MIYHIPDYRSDYHIPGNYEVNFEIINLITPVEGEEPPPLTKQQNLFTIELLNSATGEKLPYSNYLAEHVRGVDSINQYRRSSKKDRFGQAQPEEVVVCVRFNDSADGRVTAALQLLFELKSFTVRVVHTDKAKKPVAEVVLSACTVYEIQHPYCDVENTDPMITTLRVQTSAVSAAALQHKQEVEEDTTG